MTQGVSLRRTRAAGVAIIAVLTGCTKASGAAATSTPNPAVPEVTILDYKYKPRSLTVSAGATVRWINKDIAPHTATRNITEESFDSGRMVYGDIFEHTFQAPGTYSYLCFYHQGMQGVIVVE